MKRIVLILISLILLPSCTMPYQTPEEDNGGKSFENIDLEAIVIQSGDLPPMKGNIVKTLTPFSDTRTGIATSFARKIMQGDVVFGSIYVDVYVDSAQAKKAYDDGVDLLHYGAQNGYGLKTPAIGDQALLQYETNDSSTFLIFLRCHAYISISLPASEEATLGYAKRVDARIAPLVC